MGKILYVSVLQKFKILVNKGWLVSLSAFSRDAQSLGFQLLGLRLQGFLGGFSGGLFALSSSALVLEVVLDSLVGSGVDEFAIKSASVLL